MKYIVTAKLNDYRGTTNISHIVEAESGWEAIKKLNKHYEINQLDRYSITDEEAFEEIG